MMTSGSNSSTAFTNDARACLESQLESYHLALQTRTHVWVSNMCVNKFNCRKVYEINIKKHTYYLSVNMK